MLTRNQTQEVLTPNQKEKNQNQINFIWSKLSSYSQDIEQFQLAKIEEIQNLLTELIKLPLSFELRLITRKLDILIRILTIQTHKIRSKTLVLLSQMLQNMPNFTIYYFLQHSCFWALIHSGSICKEQVQGYCKLIITIFQHRQTITNQTNLSKIIELIPTFRQYVPSSLIIKLCVRLVAAIQCNNQDRSGLCFLIYSYFRDNRPQTLALIQQLQFNHRLNTSKLFKNAEEIIQMILQTLQNQNYSSNSSLEILLLFLKREQISESLRESIVNNCVNNFEKSDLQMKTVILRILYALYQSQFANWYFTRKQTRIVIQYVVDVSLSAINSEENSLAEMAIKKLHRYLNGDDYTQEYRLRAIFFNVISQPQNINKLRQGQQKLDLHLIRVVRTLIMMIKQGYSNTSYTEQSVSARNDLYQQIQIEQNEIMQQESSPLHVYQCSDSEL